MPQFSTAPPPSHPHFLISYPRPDILLITINRLKLRNALNKADHHALDSLFKWYDVEPSLKVAILSGKGHAFCAGADLKEWKEDIDGGVSTMSNLPDTGFGGLSRRVGKKPVIIAVNGICYGGGFEMVINADIVVADEAAQFALPEVKIGVAAIAGGLQRLVRTVGKQRAMEISLTGRNLSSEELRDWGVINKVVKNGRCVAEAIKIAEMISKNTPDGVILSREGINLGWESLSADDATKKLLEGSYSRVENAENMSEGVKSFLEKREPIWLPSKL